MNGARSVGEEARPRLAPGVVPRHDRARGGWVLLGPERVLVLDDVALEVIRTCTADQTTVAQGVDRLAKAFDAPRAAIAADVLDMLNDLRNRGFIIL